MRKAAYFLALVVLAASVPILNGDAQEPKKVERQKADPKKVKELMRRKLDSAQKILEAIAVNDPDNIARYATQLIQISKEAEWKVFKSALYDRNSDDFRFIAEKMVGQAKEKNLDGAKLSYLELTMTCFHCHKYVRDMAQIGTGPQASAESANSR